MKTLSIIFKAITIVVVALFVCNIDYIFDNSLVEWLVIIIGLLIADYAIWNKMRNDAIDSYIEQHLEDWED